MSGGEDRVKFWSSTSVLDGLSKLRHGVLPRSKTRMTSLEELRSLTVADGVEGAPQHIVWPGTRGKDQVPSKESVAGRDLSPTRAGMARQSGNDYVRSTTARSSEDAPTWKTSLVAYSNGSNCPGVSAALEEVPPACRAVAPEYARLVPELGRALFQLLSDGSNDTSIATSTPRHQQKPPILSKNSVGGNLDGIVDLRV